MARKSRASGVTLTGDWRRLNSFLSSGDMIVEEINQSLRSEAERIREKVSERILGEYNPPPNAPSTQRRKGVDSPLVEEGGMATRGLEVEEVQVSSKVSHYVVKGSDTETSERTGATYEYIVDLLNKGDKKSNIPSRPFLEATFDSVKETLANTMRTKLVDATRRRLR